MTRSVKPVGRAAKSGHFRKRNRNCTKRNQIPSLVRAVRELLPVKKAAWDLHILTGQAISTCQKVLSGHRPLNLDMAVAILRSDHGGVFLRAVMADAQAGWFDEMVDLADIAQLKRDHNRMRRDLERREQRLLEARGARA